MSHFYASIQGDRGEATRAGHDSITGHVRGWNSGIQVHGGRAGEADSFVVYATSGSDGTGKNQVLGELKNGEWAAASKDARLVEIMENMSNDLKTAQDDDSLNFAEYCDWTEANLDALKRWAEGKG